MGDWLRDALHCDGAGAAVFALLMVPLNFGRLWTGRAMVILASSSLALIEWVFLNPDSEGIGWQNLILLANNAASVWRHLLAGAGFGSDADVDA